MPVLTVRHTTVYRYRQPVSFGEHKVMFRPRDSYDQKLIEATLHVSPDPAEIRWVHDVFGNCVAIVRFPAARAQELTFTATIRLEHSPSNELDFQMEDYARTIPFTYGSEEMPDLLRSMERQYPDAERQVDRWARQFLRKDGPTGTRELLSAMTHHIRRNFTYIGRPDKGTQNPLQTLRTGSGTCRDFALLMMEAARSLGLAARFVSGYLYSPGHDSGPHAERGRPSHQGGGSTHAWVQVYLPGAGWIEYDPTNGIVGNRDLIRVAVVRDPRQAVPLSGTYTGFPSDHLGMTVQVDVTSAPSMHEVAAGADEELRQVGAAG